MTDRERQGGADGLVEPQGVNAGPPVDARSPRGTAPEKENGESAGPGPLDVPDQLDLLEAAPDRMAGLPEQRPGYPGQQRSVDTG